MSMGSRLITEYAVKKMIEDYNNTTDNSDVYDNTNNKIGEVIRLEYKEGSVFQIIRLITGELKEGILIYKGDIVK